MTAFFDTNVLIYAISSDPRRANADLVLREGGVISVQVLNEFANVCRRKLGQDWPRIEAALTTFRDIFDDILPLTLETHAIAIALSSNDGLSFYDALIVAAALEAGCDKLYSEDLQQGRKFGELVIINPFL